MRGWPRTEALKPGGTRGSRPDVAVVDKGMRIDGDLASEGDVVTSLTQLTGSDTRIDAGVFVALSFSFIDPGDTITKPFAGASQQGK